MSHHHSNHDRPLHLPPRVVPVLQLPLPNFPTQASASIRTHIDNAISYDEATRPPVRARKTTPPVLKGYIPVDLRPIPPVTNGSLVIPPVAQAQGYGGVMAYGGAAVGVGSQGLGAVFGVGVGRRVEGGYEQPGGMAKSQYIPWASTLPSTWSGQEREDTAAWSSSTEEGSSYGKQVGLYELVDPTTYQLDRIAGPKGSDNVSHPSSFLPSAQPRAFPVDGATTHFHTAGQFASFAPHAYVPISTTPASHQPFLNPLYPSYQVPSQTPQSTVPAGLTESTQYFSSVQPLIPSQSIDDLSPCLPAVTAGSSTRRFRIPIPIRIPSQSRIPTYQSHTVHPSTGAPSASLLMPNTAIPHTFTSPASGYIASTEPYTPFLITPFDSNFPSFPILPTSTSGTTYPAATPSFAAAPYLSSETGQYLDGWKNAYPLFKFPAEPIGPHQIPQYATASFPYPNPSWSEIGVPDLIPSSIKHMGVPPNYRVNTLFGTIPNPVHPPSARPTQQPSLKSSFLCSPTNASFPLPSSGSDSAAAKDPSHPLPKPHASPALITPPQLFPIASSSPGGHRKIKSHDKAPASTPAKYVFPDKYEFAGLVEAEGEIKRVPRRRLTANAALVSAGGVMERHGCEDCGETFSRPSDAARHKIRKHVPYNRWEYSCHLCHERFSRKDHLLLHSKRGRCPGPQLSGPRPETRKRRIASRSLNDPLGRPKAKSTD